MGWGVGVFIEAFSPINWKMQLLNIAKLGCFLPKECTYSSYCNYHSFTVTWSFGYSNVITTVESTVTYCSFSLTVTYCTFYSKNYSNIFPTVVSTVIFCDMVLQ